LADCAAVFASPHIKEERKVAETVLEV
jgi:hypothetical protein